MSDKQLTANRRNATKSTGPRTPEGKARASRNATNSTKTQCPAYPPSGATSSQVPGRHGLTSAHEVASIEDRPAYEMLRADLIAEHQPVGVQELLLVTQIAAAYHRIERAHRAQLALLEGHLDEDQSFSDDATLANTMTKRAHDHDVLRRYEATANSVYFRSLTQLLKLQALRRQRDQNGFVSQSEAPQQTIPDHSRPFAAKKTKIEILPPQDRECRTPSSTSTATPTTPSSTGPVKSSA